MRIRTLLFTLATMIALSASPLTGRIRADESIKAATVIPFVLVDSGHFLVKVKLNGKGPYQLIFDTGAPTMLINNRIAKDSGVVTPKTPRPLFAPFGAMGEFPIKRMQIGETDADNITAMVVDHPTVELFSKVYEPTYGKIDGIVGFPFFARYRMTVDYQTKTLSMIPSGYKPKNLTEAVMMKLLGGSRGPKVLAPAAQWGIIASKSTDDDESGVLVEQVLVDSAAAKAGLKTGDRLLTIDGRWTDSVSDCYQAIIAIKPGKTVKLKALRDDREFTLDVTPTSGY